MNKEQFLKSKKYLEGRILEIKEDIQQLEEQYIADNREFEDGEKVRVVIHDHTKWMYGVETTVPEDTIFAFVGGYKINYKSDIVPILKKCKKDGTISEHNLNIYTKYTIEKL